MINRSVLVVSILGAALGLTACDSDILSSGNKDDSASIPSVSVEPEAPVEEVVLGPTVIDTLADNVRPDTNMTGTASFDGLQAGASGEFSTISDNSYDRYETYVPMIRDLVPGNYRLSATLRQPVGRSHQAALRVESSGDSATFERSDILLATDGSVARQTGGFTNVETADAGDGFGSVVAEFTVAADQAGRYRFTVYPAIGSDNRYDAAATGTLDVAGITLERVELR